MSFKPFRTGDYTVELQWPFELDGHEHRHLTLRRPRTHDVRRLVETRGNQADLSSRLVADLAEVEVEVIEHLDLADMAQINVWLEPLLDPKGPASLAPGS